MVESRIRCRSCDTEFPVEDGNCPRCGAGVRRYRGPVAMIAIGVLVAGAALTDPTELWLFILVGVAMGAVGAFFIKEKRDRLVADG